MPKVPDSGSGKGIIKVLADSDPNDCPFREFKDTELGIDLWGLSPKNVRVVPPAPAPKSSSMHQHKGLATKIQPLDVVWVDEQIQPLPRSVRKYLHRWIRAETLALDRWDMELVVFDEFNMGPMSISDIQLSHAQVLQRSSFCRKVLSTCYILEKLECFNVEHQWENFTCQLGLEGWRARYHIYSPGTKPGGGAMHKPALSKNGCYLVRLYYLSAWRCVWVNDLVPVDATDAPLLPFSPLSQSINGKIKSGVVASVTAAVQLWPLLLCKALLKLAAPDMNSDDDDENTEDEEMEELSLMHALTGWLSLTFPFNEVADPEEFWTRLVANVPLFQWDDDDDTFASTIRTKSTKKPTTKDKDIVREKKHGVIVTAVLKETKDVPHYILPGITPAHELVTLIEMARDIPLKKPLPEPDVALWKTYRWIDWAKGHGLYDDYACPRTRFLKLKALMKLSHAPHLLDVLSTESITYIYRIENTKTTEKKPTKTKQEMLKSGQSASQAVLQIKEALREWTLYDKSQQLMKSLIELYFPSMYKYTSASRSPPIRIYKVSNRALEITAPKQEPLYLQIDSPVQAKLRISLTMIHPRVMSNCKNLVEDFIEPAYMLLEKIMLFDDCKLPQAKAYVWTRGYQSVEVYFLPGRHYCRLWVHSRMNWQVALLSEANLLLGSRDIILAASVVECPWTGISLSALGQAFQNWVRLSKSAVSVVTVDKEFYQSYLPDLEWNVDIAGCKKVLVHWMFRQAVQSLLKKQLPHAEFQHACSILRRYFRDPEFGMPDKPKLGKSYREIANNDPCDCVAPECLEAEEESEEISNPSEVMEELIKTPTKVMSYVCDYATDNMSCGLLKIRREKIMLKHQAATTLQAYWRGYRARKYLYGTCTFPPEILKTVLDHCFGNLEMLSKLMNEFFKMYPNIRHAYSVASALRGGNSLLQFSGVVPVTPSCTWIPFFHGVFYCHDPVKVHFDVQSAIPFHTFTVYDNDTKLPMPQVYNTHMTFEMEPNSSGYTVMGHGTVSELPNLRPDGSWQLTVLSSVESAFHVCDNDLEACVITEIPNAYKLHVDEMFLPNRRNILGGLQFIVTRTNTVSFRVAASSRELKMVAILRSTSALGEVEVMEWHTGTGEIYWPNICLDEGDVVSDSLSLSQLKLTGQGHKKSNQKLKIAKLPVPVQPKTLALTHSVEPKSYWIEVIALDGWPLTLEQWKRVDEVRNTQKGPKIDIQIIPKNKLPRPSSAKEKMTSAIETTYDYRPLPDDAYVELECSYAVDGGIQAKRDEDREHILEAAINSWDKIMGRTARGPSIRQEFRDAHLETAAPSRSSTSFSGEALTEDFADLPQNSEPANTKVDEEEEAINEEVATYLSIPHQLKDKFIPLDFVPLSTKEITEDLAYVTPNKAEAAKQERHARIESAIQRMNELQAFNETSVLGRQKKRLLLLENLFVDAPWCPEIAEVLEERDEAIAKESHLRSLSFSRKKHETPATVKKK